MNHPQTADMPVPMLVLEVRLNDLLSMKSGTDSIIGKTRFDSLSCEFSIKKE
jgi:hypothetical protein